MTPSQIRAELLTLANSDRPILVGPWLSEVGFELLYWIPFLRWAIATAKIDPARLWILSRGGCRSWYADLTPNYLELYDTHKPEELRRLNQQRIREQAANGPSAGLRRGQRTAKQYYVSNIESRLIEEASTRANLGSPMLLHPSLMYRAFRPLWRQRSTDIFAQWAQMTRLNRITPPALTRELPDRYVAVKFYASEACPDRPELRIIVHQLLTTIAARNQVVLLHTGTGYDEHGEFAIPNHPAIHRIRFSPGSNLDEQTAIIAKSRGFIGTYGGFAYLAPLLGVTTTAFYGLSNFRKDHLRLMTTVAAQQLRVNFRALALTDQQGLKRSRREWMAHAAA